MSSSLEKLAAILGESQGRGNAVEDAVRIACESLPASVVFQAAARFRPASVDDWREFAEILQATAREIRVAPGYAEYVEGWEVDPKFADEAEGKMGGGSDAGEPLALQSVYLRLHFTGPTIAEIQYPLWPCLGDPPAVFARKLAGTTVKIAVRVSDPVAVDAIEDELCQQNPFLGRVERISSAEFAADD